MLYKNSADQSVQLFRPGFIEIALFPPKGKKVKILLAFQKSTRFSLTSSSSQPREKSCHLGFYQV